MNQRVAKRLRKEANGDRSLYKALKKQFKGKPSKLDYEVVS